MVKILQVCLIRLGRSVFAARKVKLYLMHTAVHSTFFFVQNISSLSGYFKVFLEKMQLLLLLLPPLLALVGAELPCAEVSAGPG